MGLLQNRLSNTFALTSSLPFSAMSGSKRLNTSYTSGAVFFQTSWAASRSTFQWVFCCLPIVLADVCQFLSFFFGAHAAPCLSFGSRVRRILDMSVLGQHGNSPQRTPLPEAHEPRPPAPKIPGPSVVSGWLSLGACSATSRTSQGMQGKFGC